MNAKESKATIAVDPRQRAIAANWPSVNALAAPLVHELIAQAKSLRLGVERLGNGCVLVDGGIASRGGLEAGIRIAQICMGGLGSVSVQPSTMARWPLQLSVHSSDPVLACLGSQYAGWSLTHGEGKGGFHALGSGPARAAAGREELLAELAYRDVADAVCVVLEVDKKPPLEIADKIARDCDIKSDRVTLILTPTRSLAGTLQIVARVLEVALHKAHALGFPLHHIVDGAGAAPLPPPAADFLTAMGRTNDAILFGGKVQLFVDCDDGEAQRLANNLPSGVSKDYGKPFAQVFKEAQYDFYRIDPHLFAPAAVAVTALKSGSTFHAGAIDEKLLETSFGVKMPEVAILTDDPGWHGARLREAFASHGVHIRFASLRDCRFDIQRTGYGVVVPGFGDRLPDGVFVRGVPGGTLEQVVLRLDVLHALKLLGVPVYNDGRAIERTVDKAMTSFVLANAGIPTPATWVTESRGEAAAVVRAETAAGRELVLKPLFGSQGVGLMRISALDDLPPAADYDGVYYLQRFIESGIAGWQDWRVFVIAGIAVAGMRRRGKSWITNVSQGATCAPLELSEHGDLGALAQQACSALQMDYAGVDLTRDRHGRLQVIEINGIPAWKGLQSVTEQSIAGMLVNDFIDRHLRCRVLDTAA